MSEPLHLAIALIAGPLSAMLTLILTRALGYRRDAAEIDQLVSDKWREWAGELEKRVDKLERELDDERRANRSLLHQNELQGAQMNALVRWALQLRDELVRLGAHVPAPPGEIALLLPPTTERT